MKRVLRIAGTLVVVVILAAIAAFAYLLDTGLNTEMGRGLYPKAPDMRLTPTQDLTDGQLFYIIDNGIRLTGMPAWGTGTAAGEEASWRLVHFIRHLPTMTDEEIKEMEGMNPQSPEAIRQQIEEQRFLHGAGDPPAASSSHQH